MTYLNIALYGKDIEIYSKLKSREISHWMAKKSKKSFSDLSFLFTLKDNYMWPLTFSCISKIYPSYPHVSPLITLIPPYKSPLKKRKKSTAIENPLDWEADLKLPCESSKSKITKLLASGSEGKADDRYLTCWDVRAPHALSELLLATSVSHGWPLSGSSSSNGGWAVVIIICRFRSKYVCS